MTAAGDAAIAGLTCPMPTGPATACTKDVHLVWTMSMGLNLSDVMIPAPIGPSDAWVQSWTVECEDGHVLLLPDTAGCQHGQDAAPEHECNADPNEFFQSFRAADAGRLAGVLARMTVGSAAGVRTLVSADAMHFWPGGGGFLCGATAGFRTSLTSEVTCPDCKKGLGHA